MSSTVAVEAVTKRYRPSTIPRFSSISRIAEQVPAGATVLDVGCSEGYLAEQLPENSVWGIDGNSRALEHAALHCVDVAHADLNALEARVFSGRFDVVVFADVLEHLLDPVSVLRRFGEYLNPGGLAIVSVPNVAHARVRFDLLRGRFDYADYGVLDRTHLHLYTFATAQRLMAEAGFRVLQTVGASNRLGALVSVPGLRGLCSLQVVTTAELR
jgi:methionine biosynthesis protein MetW